MTVQLCQSAWKKSSYSSGNGECLEVRDPPPDGEIHIRDSKNPQGGILIFPIFAWYSFLVAVKEGDFTRARGPERIAVALEREHRT
jgi:hypothetical protein